MNYNILWKPTVDSERLQVFGQFPDEHDHDCGRHPKDQAISSVHKTKTVQIVPKHAGKLVFEPGDGDLQISINGTCFETHKYLIKRFSGLKNLLNKCSSAVKLQLQHDECGVTDFYNMLKVLYASVLEGPFEFDSPTLVSALRISTIYDYPGLRTFALKHLDQAKLTAIERIKIGREFGLASWEGPAYRELCARDEAITIEEANVLGMEAFVRVAGIREKEQQARNKVRGNESTARLDASKSACSPLLKTELGGCKVIETSSNYQHKDTLLGGCSEPTHDGGNGTKLDAQALERSFRGLSIHRDYQGLDETNPADCQCQICLRRDRPVDPFIPVSDSAPSWPRAYEYLRPFLNVFRVDSFSTHDVRSSLTPHPQRGVFLEFQLDLESTDIMPKPESESGLEATQEPEPENQPSVHTFPQLKPSGIGRERGIPDFVCKLCNKSFRSQLMFKTHMDVHKNMELFDCPFPSCGRKFAVRSNLARHCKWHK